MLLMLEIRGFNRPAEFQPLPKRRANQSFRRPSGPCRLAIVILGRLIFKPDGGNIASRIEAGCDAKQASRVDKKSYSATVTAGCFCDSAPASRLPLVTRLRPLCDLDVYLAVRVASLQQRVS
jgi:hypothetical protein